MWRGYTNRLTIVCHGTCSVRRDSQRPPLDGVFIGPYDLSLSLGLPPPSPRPHPEAEKAIQKILQVAHTAGKKWYVSSKPRCFFSVCSTDVFGPVLLLVPTPVLVPYKLTDPHSNASRAFGCPSEQCDLLYQRRARRRTCQARLRHGETRSLRHRHLWTRHIHLRPLCKPVSLWRPDTYSSLPRRRSMSPQTSARSRRRSNNNSQSQSAGQMRRLSNPEQLRFCIRMCGRELEPEIRNAVCVVCVCLRVRFRCGNCRKYAEYEVLISWKCVRRKKNTSAGLQFWGVVCAGVERIVGGRGRRISPPFPPICLVRRRRLRRRSICLCPSIVLAKIRPTT